MREILFHGKRVDNGEWIEGDLLQIKYYNKPIIECKIMPQTPVSSAYPVLPETVGQYTGLTDKNGKRIFEGDIVMFSRTRNLPNVTPVPEVIRYHKGDCAFQRFPFNIPLTRGGGGKLLQPDMMLDCEIIGNIHDNTELME